VLFVVVNQIAYTVVVRLASGGGAASAGPGQGTGYAVYSTTFLIVMVPHSVITVSLATAVLPQLSGRAADLDLRGVAASLNQTLRSALALILPFALLLPVVAPDIANAISFGAGRESYRLLITSLALFGPGVLFFTVHYLMLRGFYALERTRTVFWVQCVIAATNIAVALVLVHATDARFTSPALVLAYTASYAVGSLLSFLLLRHLLGGLRTRVLVRFAARMVIAAGISTAVAALVAHLLRGLTDHPSQVVALATGTSVLLVDVAIFLGLARLLHVHEVTAMVDTVRRRLPSSRR
jgi:putative peptidoglycan lipid II flippase